MVDLGMPYVLNEHGPSQVDSLRDRTSVFRTDSACSCDLNGRLTLRETGRSEHETLFTGRMIATHRV